MDDPVMEAALRLYHAATTPQQERDAYLILRSLGFPPAYGEDDGNTRQE
jgi:hypothetical protein